MHNSPLGQAPYRRFTRQWKASFRPGRRGIADVEAAREGAAKGARQLIADRIVNGPKTGNTRFKVGVRLASALHARIQINHTGQPSLEVRSSLSDRPCRNQRPLVPARGRIV
jgi:hypothetical protein